VRRAALPFLRIGIEPHRQLVRNCAARITRSSSKARTTLSISIPDVGVQHPASIAHTKNPRAAGEKRGQHREHDPFIAGKSDIILVRMLIFGNLFHAVLRSLGFGRSLHQQPATAPQR